MDSGSISPFPSHSPPHPVATPILTIAKACGERLPNPYHQLIVSTVVFAVLYLLTYRVLLLRFPFFSQRAKDERLQLLQRSIGPVHAVIAGWGGLEVLLMAWDKPPPAPWPVTPGLWPLIIFSMGYMLVDTFVVVLLRNRLMLLHHALTILATSAYGFHLYPGAHLQHLPTGLSIATELCTPFLHLSYLVRKLQTPPPGCPSFRYAGLLSRVQALAEACTVVSWLLFRIFIFLYFFWRIWMQPTVLHEALLVEDPRAWAWRLCDATFWESLPIKCTALLGDATLTGGYMVLIHTGSLLIALFILNLFWFQKLILAALEPRAVPILRKEEVIKKAS